MGKKKKTGWGAHKSPRKRVAKPPIRRPQVAEKDVAPGLVMREESLRAVIGRIKRKRFLTLLEKVAADAYERGYEREFPPTVEDVLARVSELANNDGNIDNDFTSEKLAEGDSHLKIENRRQRLRESLASAPNDYVRCYKLISELNHAFRDEAALVLAPQLNQALKRKPQDTYEEKQALASWVNNELRQLGLAIRCPKTGKPATLVADVRGREQDGSRFRLDVRSDDGRHIRTLTTNSLPVLELMEDEPRREGRAGLREK